MHMDKTVEQMEADVYKLYPETEGDVPLNRRKDMIPTESGRSLKQQSVKQQKPLPNNAGP